MIMMNSDGGFETFTVGNGELWVPFIGTLLLQKYIELIEKYISFVLKISGYYLDAVNMWFNVVQIKIYTKYYITKLLITPFSDCWKKSFEIIISQQALFAFIFTLYLCCIVSK